MKPVKRALQCLTSDEAIDNNGEQIEKPCSDCPWARAALNGWLGPYSIEEWLATAHYGTVRVPCHTIKETECAGFAIYQANNGIIPRDNTLLVLEPDEKLVFTTPDEFKAHHKSPPQPRKPKTMASKKKPAKPAAEPTTPHDPTKDQFEQIEEIMNNVEGDVKGVTRKQYREFLDSVSASIEMRIYGLGPVEDDEN